METMVVPKSKPHLLFLLPLSLSLFEFFLTTLCIVAIKECSPIKPCNSVKIWSSNNHTQIKPTGLTCFLFRHQPYTHSCSEKNQPQFPQSNPTSNPNPYFPKHVKSFHLTDPPPQIKLYLIRNKWRRSEREI